MTRQPKDPPNATETLTLRLTREDRALLDRLIALRAADLADDGIDVSAASYVRGLIRREARAKGLLAEPIIPEAPANPPAPAEAANTPASADPDDAFGETVRAALSRAMEAGTSQSKIALRAGVDRGRLSRFRTGTGRGGLSVDLIRKVAAVLKVTHAK